MALEYSYVGCLLGMAVGDALGLPAEGMSPHRIGRLFPNSMQNYHLFLSKGLTSDDTEHACMTAQALICSSGDVKKFTHSLAWRLRGWLLGMPAAVGWATLRAIIKLWLGFPQSGVFSAGNGPAMRSPILGVAFGSNLAQLVTLVKASTEMTHKDPKAVLGALAIAVAAHISASQETNNLASHYLPYCQQAFALAQSPDHDIQILVTLLQQAIHSAADHQSTIDFAQSLGQKYGVTGYMYHTVPVVIQCWLNNPTNFQQAVMDLIDCGGDTDTTAAILGGIIGARVGKTGIPNLWLENLWEWPRTVTWIENLGIRLNACMVEKKSMPPLPVFIPGLFLRNLFFFFLVLAHGFRRLFPPY